MISLRRFPWVVAGLGLTVLVLVRPLRVDPWPFLWHHTVLVDREWWRLLTGHWVHFTASHLFQNLAVFVCCGALLERRSRLLLVASLVFSSLVISLGLLVCDPGLAFYGGLSGINHGLLLLVGLCWLRSGHRTLAFSLWAVLALKLSLELAGHSPPLVSLAGTEVRPVPMAHLLGLLSCALLVPLWLRLDRGEAEH